MEQNWIATYGKIEFSNGTITHIPEILNRSAETTGVPVTPHSYAKSNIEFDQGTISFEIFLEDATARCMVGLKGPGNTEVYAGVNHWGAAYAFGLFINGKWEEAGIGTLSGVGNHPPVNEWVKIELSVKGSNLDLRLNGVHVASASLRIMKAPVFFLLQSDRKVKVKDIKVLLQKRQCFVVMQFTEEYNELYYEVIKKTCESEPYGYEVIKGDDSYTAGLIIQDIARLIRESNLIIADITPDNPNVFYEVGFAHGINKPTILLCDRVREKLPFDISGFRTLFYDNTIGGKSVVEEHLKKLLDSIDA